MKKSNHHSSGFFCQSGTLTLWDSKIPQFRVPKSCKKMDCINKNLKRTEWIWRWSTISEHEQLKSGHKCIVDKTGSELRSQRGCSLLTTQLLCCSTQEWSTFIRRISTNRRQFPSPQRPQVTTEWASFIPLAKRHALRVASSLILNSIYVKWHFMKKGWVLNMTWGILWDLLNLLGSFHLAP